MFGNVSIVQPAQELHLAGSEDGAEPVDGVALDVPAVTEDSAVAEELGVKSCQLFFRQNEVRICGNRETFTKGQGDPNVEPWGSAAARNVSNDPFRICESSSSSTSMACAHWPLMCQDSL